MPLYSCPHFNLTITALPFKPCKNGLGLVTPIFLSFLRAGERMEGIVVFEVVWEAGAVEMRG